MNLIPVKEVILSTTDAYILKIFKNLIVTNDELGLCIYDTNLNFIKRILWQRDIGAYMVYQSFSENKLLLDCSDDGFLLYINLDDTETVEIPICHDFLKSNFLGFLYHWIDDFILFKSSIGYIRVDLKERAISWIDESIAQEHSHFYKFCIKANEFFGPRDMPGPFQFIYTTINDNTVGYYNYLHNLNYEIDNLAVIDHSIAYSNKNFAIINARQFRVISIEGIYCDIQARQYQEFFIAQFQNDGEHLVVLNSQFIDDLRIESLIKYQLTG